MPRVVSLLRSRRLAVALLAALAAGVAASAGAPAALADTTVKVSGPSGSGCTLQDAVAFADNPKVGVAACNAAGITGSAGTITIGVPAGDYELSSTLALSSPANVVIAGSGSGTSGTVIDGDGAVQPIDVESGQVTISGVRVQHGYAGTSEPSGTAPGDPIEGNSGGGISSAGTLTLDDDVITDNSAGSGGVVPCSGGVACADGKPGGNGGLGGGVFGSGSLTITSSTISDNHAGNGGAGDPGTPGSSASPAGGAGGDGGDSGFGGGVYSLTPGTLLLSDSTITGNTAGASGSGGRGGNAAAGSNANGGNGGVGPAADGGSGAGVFGDGPMTISASTISDNVAGVGGSGGGGGRGAGTGVAGANEPGSAGGGAGGVGGFSAATTIEDSTIVGNRAAAGGSPGTGGTGAPAAGAPGFGAGFAMTQFAISQPLLQDTIVDNVAPAGGIGGIDALPNASSNAFGSAPGSITVANSIVASNSPVNCSADVTGVAASGSSSDIAFGDSSCSGFETANPMLGPLADNGGPTETMALAPGSPALGLDPASSCPLGVDQRGVARPQPGESGCDAGAYEHAVPVISGVGAAPTSSGATVSAQINPELSSAGTSVVVDYGTTGAYGSTVSGTTIARGAVAVPFSATLSGLAPGTTYHYRLVATNGEPAAGPDGTPGQAVSADATFTTAVVPPPPPPPPPPVTPKLQVSVESASASGAKAHLTLGCSGGGAGARCSGAVKLTAREKVAGKKVAKVAGKKVAKVAGKKVAKVAGKKVAGRKRKTRAVEVARGSYAVASGKSQTISLSLDKKGRSLLAASYKLPVSVSLGGRVTTSRINFSYPKIKAIILYTAKWNGHGLDTITGVMFNDLPKGAVARFACERGSCSPRSAHFAVKKRSHLSLGQMKVKLRRGAKLALEVTHAGQVGHVVEVFDDSDEAPAQSILCLPPGAKRPMRCA